MKMNNLGCRVFKEDRCNITWQDVWKNYIEHIEHLELTCFRQVSDGASYECFHGRTALKAVSSDQLQRSPGAAKQTRSLPIFLPNKYKSTIEKKDPGRKVTRRRKKRQTEEERKTEKLQMCEGNRSGAYCEAIYDA